MLLRGIFHQSRNADLNRFKDNYYYLMNNKSIDARMPAIVKNTPELKAFVPGLNIQNAEILIKNNNPLKMIVK